MNKVVIVNCFDTYEDRVDLVLEFFKEQGFDTKVIQSDFRHFEKVTRTEYKDDFVFVKSTSYNKNMSVRRLYSHYKFAGEAFALIEEMKPDLLYTFVPPNSLAKFAAMYKRKHKDVKLILDLIDLWPETMPIGSVKKLMPFLLWRSMRDDSLKYADLVITECDLYQSVLCDKLVGVNKETLYLANKEIEVFSNPQLSNDEIHLAYLGSINNIIDIAKIKEIISNLVEIKPVTLHIIGDGESKLKLIRAVEEANAKVEYYGNVYDPQKKQDIFDKCHFGLNIMKDSVCVGLTMKSIDYFQNGLPIINNIPADTSKLVEKYGVGINVHSTLTLLKIRQLSDSCEAIVEMKKRSIVLYDQLFSRNAFRNKLFRIISALLDK